ALQVEALPGGESLGERQRRRPASVLAAEPVELLGEGRVGAGLSPAGLELVERRDQGLRDVAAAVVAEVHLAAARNARPRSGSLFPGEASRLELASTAQGRVSAIAFRTFSGPRPPASTRRPSTARARSKCAGSCSCHGRSITVATCSPSRSS